MKIERTIFEKQRQLEMWLGKDVSTWRAKRIHAVYAEEKRKRAKLFMKEFF